MNLIERTCIGNGTQAVMPSDAVLMSMLPYGVGRKDILTLYFSSTRNGNRTIKGLVEKGMVEEHSMEVKSPRRNYTQCYLSITVKGLEYLAEKYDYLYPWLSDAVESIREQGRANFVRGISPGTLHSLLTAHACNVAFNVVSGVGTFFERLIYEPEKALTTMSVHLSTTGAGGTAFRQIYESYRQWLEGVRAQLGRPVRIRHPSPSPAQFYDAVELKVPDHSPYQDVSNQALTQTAAIVERRERMAGHVGLLRTSQKIYVVYISSRDGATWNSALIAKGWQSFTAQALRLGLVQSITEAPNIYPSILLVDGVGEKISAFQRVVQDPCELRSKKNDRVVGRSVSALYAIPIVRSARLFLRFFVCHEHPLGFRRLWIETLERRFPETFQRGDAGEDYPMIYQHRLPCYFGMDMDLHQINAAAEAGRCAVVCLEWQAKYIRAVVPDARIVVVDVQHRSVWEYEG